MQQLCLSGVVLLHLPFGGSQMSSKVQTFHHIQLPG